MFWLNVFSEFRDLMLLFKINWELPGNCLKFKYFILLIIIAESINWSLITVVTVHGIIIGDKFIRNMSEDRKMYKCTCSDCGKDSEVPFEPKPDRPVYCKECLPKRRGN